MRLSRPFTHFPSLLYAIIVVFSFAACGGPEILIVRDQYWAAIEFDEQFESKLQTGAKARGMNVNYIDVSFPVDQSEVSLPISASKSEIVLLSPLLSQFAEIIAGQESARKIVAFGTGADDVKPMDNLTLIQSNRRSAYNQAGKLCRQYLQAPGNELKRVAGIFYSGGSERNAERLAFADGLGEGMDERFFLETFPRLDVLSEVNNFLAGVSEENIGLFVVSVSGINRDVISSIISRFPSLIIVERAGSGPGTPYADRIVATFEEQWSDFFIESLPDPGKEVFIETSLLPGPAAFSTEASWTKGFFIEAREDESN
jgi:hypothetical protein